MTSSENIKTSFPDKYGIKDNLRNGQSKSGNFLELTIDSYKILSSILNEELTVKESLQHNQNLSIFTHQILAANKIKNEFGGNAILSDEVGLGKTIEAGIIIKEFLVTGLAQKILILTPPSLLTQWQDEMNSKFNLDFISQKTDNRFRDVFSHDLLIMSHSSAVFPTFSKALESIPWDLVIVDEAHSMKNSETKKHKLVRNLTKKFLLLLTATPVQNNLLELYNLVDLLQPGLLGTWKQFQERYTIDRQSRKLNSIFKDELQTLLSEVIIRTTRNEVKEITFTERLPNTEILKPSGEEKLLYSKITDAIRDAYEADDGSNFLALMTYQRLAASSTMSAKGAIKRMLQNKIISNDKYEEMISISNKIKHDAKFEYLKKIISRDDSKFLIFTEFYATQDYIEKELSSMGYLVTLFNGKMSSELKAQSIKAFKAERKIMISTGAGGEGQNFQFCHNIINYDLPWNPMKIEQKIGRVHRIGQIRDVNIYNFAVEGTIESYILKLLFQKINLFKMTLGELDLIFEDESDSFNEKTWLREFLTSENHVEIENKFTVLGENLEKEKTLAEVKSKFSEEVFENFDLSTMGK